MGFLKQLDVDNFKSWRGKQVIGPFKRFNCIIGTNGSGKSNVMDALSFVMGERAATLRVKHTRDLIHGAHIGRPVSTTASVTMRYCDDNGEELNFCRSISGDSSEYRINGRQITLAKYTEELEKIGIVTKARNCLVFQGAVESIAMKNPKERTKMFERISQSLELSNDYDRRKEALQKAKEDTQFHFNKKRTATAEKKEEIFYIYLRESEGEREREKEREERKKGVGESRQQEEVLSAELQRGRVRGEEVNQELGEVLGELQNARLDSQESKRQQQRNEVLENLRRLYPDTLFGRLVDLCSPIHKKYQLAVTKVFGRYMNAIVVSSEKVARDCIRFVKEERAEPETFLPIDYLDVSPLNERLRVVRGAKMMVDVVQCSPTAPQLKKVIQFVCGNALVCETLKEARAIAFDGPERLKTVALDGTMFSKSGVISGGSSHLRSKARRWDEKDMIKLKELKEQLTAELRGLVKLKRKEPELKQIQSQAQGVQTRLKYSHTELDTLRKKSIPNCHAEMSRLEAELANVESQLEMQKENMEVKELKMKKLQDRINQMEDVVFSDFCAEIGVANIREYEQEHLKQQQDVDRKRLEFESQRTCLKAQLEYEQGQLEQQRKKMKKLEETIAKEQSRVEEQKQAKHTSSPPPFSTFLDFPLMLSPFILLSRPFIPPFLPFSHQLLKSSSKITRNVILVELVKLQREVISAETALEQLRIWKHNLLLGCKIQGLPITLLSGSLDEIINVLYSPQLCILRYAVQTCVSLCLQDLAGEEVDPQVERLKETLSSLEGVLQRSTAPNLKALEKMREVKDKFQGVVDAFDASTKAARRSNQEFEQVKAKRFRLFSQCFEHVSVVIDQIYKQLCRNTSAQAILSAENPDEPYLDGINYNCIAPGKRFMAMDNLSGGEKVIAALVMALHTPFFVLDEVDAALDNTNIGKVTSFIREQSRESLQIIVISLKEEFYSRADALLGVYPEFNECMFSRMLTLDLSPYPKKERTIKRYTVMA
uniref:Structural maintenance of chromosomes 1B n=1 Tax=Hucho hucho TaxID=62062 RepID=A0A4W5RWE3_9TELE